MQKVDIFTFTTDILPKNEPIAVYVHIQDTKRNSIINLLKIAGIFLFLLLLSLFSLQAQTAELYAEYEPVVELGIMKATGGVIQIRGEIVEQASGKPFELAMIVVKCGDQIVASKHSAKDGSFLLTIPPEKASHRTFVLRIKYLDHIFIQENIILAPQRLRVEINGEVFLENDLLEAYKLPIHTLGTPKVGTVTTELIRSIGKGISKT